MKTTIAYFSPTGGAKRAASLLGEALDAGYSSLDLTEPAGRQNTYTFDSQELLVVASPVYGGQLPQVKGLFQNLCGRQTPCVILAAYGNRHYDDTLAQMKHLLTVQGFTIIAAIAPVIPHIYSEKLGTGRPDEKDIRIIEDFAGKVLEKLGVSPLSPVSLPGNETPPPKEMKPVSKAKDNSLCIGCGLCADVCPVHAIDPSSLAWKDDLCINCMRCVKSCPEGALSFDAAISRAYLEANYTAPREIETFL